MRRDRISPTPFRPGSTAASCLTADGTGFYYSLRSRQTGARIRRHTWRSDVAADPLVFGEGYGPRSFVSVAAIGRRPLARLSRAARVDVHRRVRLDLRTRGAVPFAIVVDAGARFYPRFVQGALWMRTDLDAPNNRVVAVDLDQPGA